MKVLFATSEVHPLIKTGGLADVSAGLPRALKNLRNDVRIILPAYRGVLEKIEKKKTVATISVSGARDSVQILETRLPSTTIKVYLVHAPWCFDRSEGPYVDSNGQDWPDNAQRFTLFARAAAILALNQADLDWQPDVVHCNDWQTGLIPPLLSQFSKRPATVFTVHNLAYHGLADRQTFQQLKLPAEWWSLHALEFHGGMSFIKGGLVFADWITTVSATYAKEIRTKQFGCGLEQLLEYRKHRLTGILNGVDYKTWSPGKDALIPQPYTARNLKLKIQNKLALQEHFGLTVGPDIPVFAHVGRLEEQKGIDLLLAALPKLRKRNMQIVIVGTGQPNLEEKLSQAAAQHSEKLGIHIGYDENLAHLLEAGADAFLMPSRFEPCGLNQMYSLRYGTLPIVRCTGGLADTVVDTTDTTLSNGTATGFVFRDASPQALLLAIERALTLYKQPNLWNKVMRVAMKQDFSWNRSAKHYMELYQGVLGEQPELEISV